MVPGQLRTSLPVVLPALHTESCTPPSAHLSSETISTKTPGCSGFQQEDCEQPDLPAARCFPCRLPSVLVKGNQGRFPGRRGRCWPAAGSEAALLLPLRPFTQPFSASVWDVRGPACNLTETKFPPGFASYSCKVSKEIL